MLSDFSKWWADPKKHAKRLNHWLPHLRMIAKNLNGTRNIRYFTLCASEMIDVFMLVNDGLLQIDQESDAIQGVQFCECVPDDYTEILEMIGAEDAGLFGKLQEVALFEDDEFTGLQKDADAISIALDDAALAQEKVDRLQLKLTFMHLRDSFPYDYINLDFCDYYYLKPPDVLTITRTVEQFLGWQQGLGASTEDVSVDEFVLAVTCRYDSKFPSEAKRLLTELVQDNCNASVDYEKQIRESRKVTKIEEWVKKDHEDFFLAAWPKDVARIAKTKGWKTDILDYVYYQRPADGDVPYIIVCLVVKFSRENGKADYTPAALHALDRNLRHEILDVDRRSKSGKQIIANLEEIRGIRNERARRINRAELPPLT